MLGRMKNKSVSKALTMHCGEVTTHDQQNYAYAQELDRGGCTREQKHCGKVLVRLVEKISNAICIYKDIWDI